jgi:zinc protease
MRRILLLLVLMLGIGVAAQDEDVLDLETYALENGLEVILVRDDSAPTVAVSLLYRVGSADDPEGKNGFAHLFEHVMFQGSANVEPGQFDQLLELRGAQINAFVSNDFTVYYETLPSNQLPLALWLEADRMASLAVTQAALESERSIVFNEYYERVGNAPYGQAIQTLFTIPFDYPPYEQPVIGNLEDLNRATLDTVQEFHDTYYVPNNATLAVVGDIDFDVARAYIGDYFGSIPAGENVPERPMFDLALLEPEAEERLQLTDPLASLPALMIGYQTPPANHPDYPAIELLSRILAVGNSSRLSVNVVDQGEALAAQAFSSANQGPSLFGAFMLPNFGGTLEDLEAIYNRELTNIVDNGVTQEELDRAVNQIRSSRVLELETVLSLALTVQEANYYYGDPLAFYDTLEAVEAVTPEDVQRVAAEYLAPERAHVLEVTPGAAAEAEELPDPLFTDDPSATIAYDFVQEQTTPPEPLEQATFTLPEITTSTLGNGLEVIVVEQPLVPIISANLYMVGGEAAAPPDKAGIAGMTGYLLTRGTATRSAQELSAIIEADGGSLTGGASSDALNAGVFGLVEQTELAFELLGDVVLNPAFSEDEVALALEQSLSGLENSLDNADFVAGRTFTRTLYAGHPYGNVETLESIEGMTRDDIVAFYESQAHPENAYLIVTGDITTERALELADATFGAWEGVGEFTPLAFPEIDGPDGLQIVLVDRPDSTQAEIRIGAFTPPGLDGQYPARVMTNILGQGFSSRLFEVVREELGYAYSIFSTVNFPADQGRFLVSLGSANETAIDAVQQTLNEVKRIREAEVEEIGRASCRERV